MTGPSAERSESGLHGRVAIVTGGGRGVGRLDALELVKAGAQVVVNDLGCEPDGTGADPTVAGRVADEICEAGGAAIADGSDASEIAGAEQMLELALSTFGRVDILVNNAGILRDRMLANMSEEEWDAIQKMHLRSTFACSRVLAGHWRDLAKAGAKVDGRIINTSSASGLYANVGQSNYGAAKAGIASFSQIAAKELGRYGVTVNAIAPIASTRLTAGVMSDEEKAHYDPAHVAAMVAWLSSPAAREVTGQVFNVGGGHISIAESWHQGPVREKGGFWSLAELDVAVPEMLAEAAPAPDILGARPKASANGS
jgi:NAD(P)-dependent dehydrogenase (short-subunit alcohol dehydrogenase family)